MIGEVTHHMLPLSGVPRLHVNRTLLLLSYLKIWVSSNIHVFYKAGCANEQNETNTAFWSATWKEKNGLSCPLETSRIVPQEQAFVLAE